MKVARRQPRARPRGLLPPASAGHFSPPSSRSAAPRDGFGAGDRVDDHATQATSEPREGHQKVSPSTSSTSAAATSESGIVMRPISTVSSLERARRMEITARSTPAISDRQ